MNISDLSDVEVNQECAKILFGHNNYVETTLPFHILRRLEAWELSVKRQPYSVLPWEISSAIDWGVFDKTLPRCFLASARKLNHWTPPAPKEEWEPWDFESVPLGVHLKSKHCKWKLILTGASVDGANGFSYRDIFDGHTLLDGSPAGKKKEGKR